jgi:hypothetical protein
MDDVLNILGKWKTTSASSVLGIAHPQVVCFYYQLSDWWNTTLGTLLKKQTSVCWQTIEIFGKFPLTALGYCYICEPVNTRFVYRQFSFCLHLSFHRFVASHRFIRRRKMPILISSTSLCISFLFDLKKKPKSEIHSHSWKVWQTASHLGKVLSQFNRTNWGWAVPSSVQCTGVFDISQVKGRRPNP